MYHAFGTDPAAWPTYPPYSSQGVHCQPLIHPFASNDVPLLTGGNFAPMGGPGLDMLFPNGTKADDPRHVERGQLLPIEVTFKHDLKQTLQNKRLVQVVLPRHQSDLVLKVIEETNDSYHCLNGRGLIQHRIDCAGMSTCLSLVDALCRYLPGLTSHLPGANAYNLVSCIQREISRFQCPHFWLFQNCEALRQSSREQQQFVDFLLALSQLQCTLNVLFTTDSHFPTSRNLGLVELAPSCFPDMTLFHGISGAHWTRPLDTMTGPLSANPPPPAVANIRSANRRDICQAMKSRNGPVQVRGPPLVGKSTVVLQALADLQQDASFPRKLVQHHVVCKGLNSFDQFLDSVCNSVPHLREQRSAINKFNIVDKLFEMVRSADGHENAWVFHKCESLCNVKDVHEFLGNLARQANTSVLFTTFKQFPVSACSSVVQVDVLLDLWEIVAVLQFYAPNVPVINYVHVLMQNNLCIPSAVRHLAETFLQNRSKPLTADAVELVLRTNMFQFLSELWAHRLEDVEVWLSPSTLTKLVHFCHTTLGSFDKELFRQVVCPEDDEQDWLRKLDDLKRKFVMREEGPMSRLRVHPLLVLYSQAKPGVLVQRGASFDKSCQKFVNFVCRILGHATTNTRQHGPKSAIYGTMLHQWPNLQHTLEMAIHCNVNTYRAFWKVADEGSYLITKWFPQEAPAFYQSMVESATLFGSNLEKAVMEAHYGYAISLGKTTKTGCNWDPATQHVKSAIQTLCGDKTVPAYYLMTAYIILAKMEHRQGNYNRSLVSFNQATRAKKIRNMQCSTTLHFVSDERYDELEISMNIHKSIPLVFIRDLRKAQHILATTLLYMETNKLHHFDKPVALNMMGVMKQRGNEPLNEATLYFEKSLEERMYLEKMCPRDLIVPFNNIAMPLAQQGAYNKALAYLDRALVICKRTDYKHFITSLTLYHIGDVNFRMANYETAYKYVYEANTILEKTAKDHDMRLKMNLFLAHTSIIGQRKNLDCGPEPPEFYLQKVQELYKGMSGGGISDDGLHFMMASHQHSMMLHWQNSPQKFDHHWASLCDLMTENEFVQKQLTKPANLNTYLLADKNIFDAFYGKEFHLKKWIKRVCHNCAVCRLQSGIDTMWEDMAIQRMEEREARHLYFKKVSHGPIKGDQALVSTMSETQLFSQRPGAKSVSSGFGSECISSGNVSERSKTVLEGSPPSQCSFLSERIINSQREALKKYTKHETGVTQTNNADHTLKNCSTLQSKLVAMETRQPANTIRQPVENSCSWGSADTNGNVSSSVCNPTIDSKQQNVFSLSEFKACESSCSVKRESTNASVPSKVINRVETSNVTIANLPLVLLSQETDNSDMNAAVQNTSCFQTGQNYSRPVVSNGNYINLPDKLSTQDLLPNFAALMSLPSNDGKPKEPEESNWTSSEH